jgi:hypothetical protein
VPLPPPSYLSICLSVVMSGAFILFLLHNHLITDFFLKKKSGGAKDSANFPPFFLLHKTATCYTPPLPSPSFSARTQNLYSPF